MYPTSTEDAIDAMQGGPAAQHLEQVVLVGVLPRSGPRLRRFDVKFLPDACQAHVHINIRDSIQHDRALTPRDLGSLNTLLGRLKMLFFRYVQPSYPARSLIVRVLMFASIISFFKTLVDHEVTVELKNDIQIRGTLKSVDQYLNIKLDDIQVVEELKYPHLVSARSSWLGRTIASSSIWEGSALERMLISCTVLGQERFHQR